MKTQKLSLIVAFSAALAVGVLAQGNSKDNKDNKKPKSHPAVHHAAPKVQHQNHAVTGNQNKNRVSNVNHNNSISHPVGATGKFSGVSAHPGAENNHRTFGNNQGTGGAQHTQVFTRTGNNSAFMHGSGMQRSHTSFGQGAGAGHGSFAGTGQMGHAGAIVLHHSAPVQPGVNAPSRTAFKNPGAPVSSHNYPHPHYGNTYITNNTTIINNNYRYDSTHYSVHVNNFSGYQSESWGGHWRYGYYHPEGLHISLGFGFYVYTPYYTDCVASPWYYYPTVPAYIPAERVVVVPGYSCDWRGGETVGYAGYADLTAACNVIRDTWNNGDPDIINSMLNMNNVAVFSEGSYEYTLNSSDFLQMLADNIRSTQTVNFNLTRVRRYGSNAVVECAHAFANPQTGATETVYQRYRLRTVNGHFYITDFETSHVPFDV